MKYQVKIGNPDSGPLAFVVHGIEAQTPEDALSIAKRWLGDVADGIRERCGDDDEGVEVLVNPSSLVLTQVAPDEWPDEDQDDDEWEDDDDDSEDNDDDEWIEDDEGIEDDEAVEADDNEPVAMYLRALRSLQRRDFAAAAETLGNVIARYPDERELVERARRYLRVCKRANGDDESNDDER